MVVECNTSGLHIAVSFLFPKLFVFFILHELNYCSIIGIKFLA